MARVAAILGGREIGRDEALDVLLAHLRANLRLPCEVNGIEDFRWEEPYLLGGWSPAKYEKLKQARPSYTDRFELLSIERGPLSEWMLSSEDLAANVQRVSDGKPFVLGLAELRVTDRRSPNEQLLRDYAVWFANAW